MAKRRTRKKRTTKKRATRRRRGTNLTAASWSELQGEMHRREAQLAKLEERRALLLEEVDALDKEIKQQTGGVAPARRTKRRTTKKRGRRAVATRRKTTRRRARNKMNLVQALQKTLQSKTLSVTEAAAAVQKGGYKTHSANFRTIVNQTLIKNPKLFKKVARGQYTAK